MILLFYNQTAETSIFSEICLWVEFSRQKDYFAGEIEMIYRWTTKTYIFKFSITTTFEKCQSNSSTKLLLQILCIFRFLLTKATSLECICEVEAYVLRQFIVQWLIGGALCNAFLVVVVWAHAFFLLVFRPFIITRVIVRTEYNMNFIMVHARWTLLVWVNVPMN